MDSSEILDLGRDEKKPARTSCTQGRLWNSSAIYDQSFKVIDEVPAEAEADKFKTEEYLSSYNQCRDITQEEWINKIREIAPTQVMLQSLRTIKRIQTISGPLDT